MIVLRSPRLDRPDEIDGKKLENFWRSHQVPVADVKTNENLRLLEDWMKSYRPGSCSMRSAVQEYIQALAPKGNGAWAATPTPTARCGETCSSPPLRTTPLTCRVRDYRSGEHLSPRGGDPRSDPREPRRLPALGPMVPLNRLQAVYETTKKVWMANFLPEDLNGSELSAMAQ